MPAVTQVDQLRALHVSTSRRACRERLLDFVRGAWSTVDPAEYVDAWHVGAVCEHLEAVSSGEILELALALPPGTSKSLLVSVFWPAWHWAQLPTADPAVGPAAKFMYASVDATLAKRDSNRTKKVVDSTWYAERFGVGTLPELLGPARVVDRSGEVAEGVSEWYTTAGGMRFATTPGSRAVGWHCHFQIGDDLVKPEEVSEATCAERWEWWSRTMASRAVPGQRFSRVVMSQRLHPRDPVGRAREDGYEYLVLPMTHDPRRWSLPRSDERALRPTKIAPRGQDPRTEPGEPLCPGLQDPEAARRRYKAHYHAQCEQDTTVTVSRLFPRAGWARRYRALPDPRAASLAWSWDLRFNLTDEPGAYVVGLCFAAIGADSYLLEERRGLWGPEDSKRQILEGARARPGPVLIERKASATAVADALALDVPGIVLLEPRGSKVVRAEGVVEFVRNVVLPDALVAPWVEDWITELETFPSKPDDRADALTQYLAWRYLGKQAGYQRGLRGLGRGPRR